MQGACGASELYSAPRLSFSIALRLNSLLSWQLEGGQRSYTQFQNVGIKNKLNAGTLQMAQLTPPSWRVGAACDPRALVTMRRIRSSSSPSFLLLHKTPIKTCSKSFFFLFLDSLFTEVLVAFQTTARKLRDLSLTDNRPNRRRSHGTSPHNSRSQLRNSDTPPTCIIEHHILVLITLASSPQKINWPPLHPGRCSPAP